LGRGLAATPNDLGKMGIPPTHPSCSTGWPFGSAMAAARSKVCNRLIVTSAVYRQASAHNAEYAKADGDNLYLWRMNRVAAGCRIVRDAVLSVSGKLERGPWADRRSSNSSRRPAIHVTPHVDYANFDIDHPAVYRRSVLSLPVPHAARRRSWSRSIARTPRSSCR